MSKITKDELSSSLLEMIESSDGNLANGKAVKFKKNTVTVTTDVTTVNIGISSFNKVTDLLMVYKNSTYLEEGIDYIISSNNATISQPGNVAWTDNRDGTIFNFVSFEPEIVRGPQGIPGADGPSVSIIDNLTSGGSTKALSAQQGVVLNEKIKVNSDKLNSIEPSIQYGIEWDAYNNRSVRIKDSIGKTYEDFNRIEPWASMQLVTINKNGVIKENPDSADRSIDNTFVRIKKFYYKTVPLETSDIPNGGKKILKAQWLISTQGTGSFKVHPAFLRNGKEVDCVYYAAYEGSAFDVSANKQLLNDEQVVDFNVDLLCSVRGAYPISGKTQKLSLENSRKLANNNGSGYSLTDFTTTSAIQLLLLVEYGGFDSQSYLGNGNVSATSSPVYKQTGGTTGVVNGSTKAPNYTTYTDGMSYRYIEQLYGNMYKYIDGISVKGDGENKVYWDNDLRLSDTHEGYTKADFCMLTDDGFCITIGYDEHTDFGFLCTEGSGGSNRGLFDSLVQNPYTSDYLTVRFGGASTSREIMSEKGAGAFHLNTEFNARECSSNTTARLQYIPQ